MVVSDVVKRPRNEQVKEKPLPYPIVFKDSFIRGSKIDLILKS